LGNNGTDGIDNIKMDLRKLVATMYTGFIWFRIAPVAASYNNEPPYFMQGGEFHD
jgi:hypothetical protein